MAPKRRRYHSPPPVEVEEEEGHPPIAHAELYIEAHEATLIYGQSSLARQVSTKNGEGSSNSGRLQKWHSGTASDGLEIWVDRYDALNLLTTLPSLPSAPSSPTRSDSGFTDLPSDSEEMFYFDAKTREEVQREKKRRKLELDHEVRMKAREEEDRLRDGEKEEDEEKEPSESQLLLMTKLHDTLLNAQDPTLLEIRITANHGNDPRFSFLHKGGKWREVWEGIRKTKATPKAEPVMGSSLVAYGSDSESGTEGKEDADDEEKKKMEAKAEKLKEWSRKRKEAREGVS